MRTFLVSLIIIVAVAGASRIPVPALNARSANPIAVGGLAALAGQDDPEPTCSPVGQPCTPVRCCPGLACVGFHASPGSACIQCPPGWICPP
ncbi:hypothetical protein AB1N83_012882 [Pleurotus pulmonarius]